MLRLSEIRSGRVSALGMLILAWACVPAMAAPQQSAGADTTIKKPSAKPSARKHHTTSAPASSAAGKSASTPHTTSSIKHSSHRKKSVRARGQQKIDSERAQAIQEALIRAHYLSGGPTGTWNQASEDAMRRYQADHGWQAKTVPDSRALISLGLGPSKDHLLNPESAMTSGPDAPRTATLTAAPQHAPAASSTPAPSSTPDPVPAQSDPPSPQ
ncbi:MAG TPA: peptidoglycan-binding protein [Candidatus Sulfotelmatobacter sp.]|nr:peptidoglycan-binding protein [Candidatus Sulfotelmatobacter sp.]